MQKSQRISWLGLLLVAAVGAPLGAADPPAALLVEGAPIPWHQDHPPGPALSPEEAIARMKVPEGFSVELVASEPDIVNPVAMTFDERGRIWITESLEYPRLEAGEGRDRVKVLEDTDGDGRADRFSVFAEGLNIPSGIAVGHGGVWVANAPDILFLQDTDGDGRADRREVVVTGFGRADTHELPNSLRWGPDGWLYGLNGVFNRSRVGQPGKQLAFTCAVWRLHPRTREFELFAQGTSNPWGIAFDPEGSLFVSACVIDHLWHLTQTGYYQRQAGDYPASTWILGSIVDHAHQKAAYCGLEYFDSDAYPEPYRDRLYMGNIHGGCINVDRLDRRGASYVSRGEADFLVANDAWFMPVSQKTGPDGCLYVLDWYDQFHCYQDARRDEAGVDRLKGRLYRVRYGQSPRVARFDLATETNEQLVARLHSPNLYDRDTAQRLLSERGATGSRQLLEALVRDEQAPRKARLHALWALVAQGPLDAALHLELLKHADSGLRAWAVRAAGNQRDGSPEVAAAVRALAADSTPEVLVQVAIASRRIESIDALDCLVEVLAHAGDDALVPAIVWQNMLPLVDDQAEKLLDRLAQTHGRLPRPVSGIMSRLLDHLLTHSKAGATAAVRLLGQETDPELGHVVSAKECLLALTHRLQSRGLADEQLAAFHAALDDRLNAIQAAGAAHELYLPAVVLAASWKDPQAIDTARELFAADAQPLASRLEAFHALAAVGDPELPGLVAQLLQGLSDVEHELARQVLAGLGRVDNPQVPALVLAAYGSLPPELKPVAIELLSQRHVWVRELLAAMTRGEIAANVLNANQVRRLLSSDDESLKEQVLAIWGSVRTERNPEREEVIRKIKSLLESTPGDPLAGVQVFDKVCAQCHKIHGRGQDVGPDLTSNGRSSWEQLLSNVLDPSLVIGADFEARIVATADGRLLSGLLVEDTPQHLVLKVQGGKRETILRDQIEQSELSRLSLMPEELEKQLSAQELADLFAYLALDKPPDDPAARRLSGSPQPVRR